MRVIFITLAHFEDVNGRGIYSDLMRKFRDEGHEVYIVSPCERRMGKKTHIKVKDGVTMLNVRTLNIQKTSIVEKGVGTLMIEGQFKRAIKKHLNDVRFDLILYSTPPITFTNVVRCLKKRNPQAVSYLLLKDIFPQNAVDIGMFSEGSLFYKYFRRKEVALYKTSDYIGCMSPANLEYLLAHNDFLEKDRVEVAPNSIELCADSLKFSEADGRAKHSIERTYIRHKYNLPIDKPVFIYGGNLGKPQGIPFLIGCLSANASRKDCYFVVVGTGTEYEKLETWCNRNLNVNLNLNDDLNDDHHSAQRDACQSKGFNVRVMNGLPKEDYDELVRTCDVGLIFLDHRFTIPNYPSRLLSYLENKIPVLCATDPNTDIGRIAEENGYGYWCESNSVEAFTAILNKMIQSDRKSMGMCGYEFLKKNYLVEHTYNAIMKHVKR